MISLFFERPEFLWLLLLIPFLIFTHFLFLRLAQNKAMRFANFETLKRVDGKRRLVKNWAVLFLRIFAVLFVIVALAELTVYYPGFQSDVDYVLAIDNSPSMVTEDITPNRLEAAKMHASIFLNSLSAQTQVGLISFSGITYVQNTLSTSHFDIGMNIELLDIARVAGTDTAGAIVAGTNLLTMTDNGRAIILFTDGIDTVGSYIDDSVTQAVQYAIENDVVIHTVGYGMVGAIAGYLPSIYNISASIDRERLDFVAQMTGGQSFYPTTNQEAQEIFTRLTSEASPAQLPYPLRQYGIFFALALLFVEWFVLNIRFRRIA